VNRSGLDTLAWAMILLLALVAWWLRIDAWNLKNQVEAQDQRLRDIREGWNGLDELHNRVTDTWLEQIRLQRELNRLQKPAGAIAVPKDIPQRKEGGR